MKKKFAFIGVPTHSGSIEGALANSLLAASDRHQYKVTVGQSSLLARGFNRLWIQALELRRAGVTHFLMIHADVVPLPGFLDRMLDIMEEKKAGVLSAVSPIKGEEGATSTAIDADQNEDHFLRKVKRLTLKEIYETFEKTFTYEGLLVNTGLMLVDLSKSWVEKVYFRIQDQVRVVEGKLKSYTIPEDWDFSRQVRDHGGTVWATREIALKHVGHKAYMNTHVWGHSAKGIA